MYCLFCCEIPVSVGYLYICVALFVSVVQRSKSSHVKLFETHERLSLVFRFSPSSRAIENFLRHQHEFYTISHGRFPSYFLAIESSECGEFCFFFFFFSYVELRNATPCNESVFFVLKVRLEMIFLYIPPKVDHVNLCAQYFL